MRMPLPGAHVRATSTPQGSGPCLDRPFDPPVYCSLGTVAFAGAVGMILLSRRRRRSRAGIVGEDAIGSCVFVLAMLLLIGVLCILPTMLRDPGQVIQVSHEVARPSPDSVFACRCAKTARLDNPR
ncbi:hypothetical protein SAMN02787076_05169 [Rhizobacter sp. OV335]|nr:hypothetical protein SAMN02787076_05169 [Rhizobacter sp. OV335]